MTGRPGISHSLAGTVLLVVVVLHLLPTKDPRVVVVTAGPVDALARSATPPSAPDYPRLSQLPARDAGGGWSPSRGRGVEPEAERPTALPVGAPSIALPSAPPRQWRAESPSPPRGGVGQGSATTARGAAPESSATEKRAALTATSDDEPKARAAAVGSSIAKLPPPAPPTRLRNDRDDARLAQTQEPPIRPVAPIAVQPTPPVRELPAVPATAPAQLPPLFNAPAAPSASDAPVPVGPIVVGDHALTFDSLSKLVDGQGGTGAAGCATCGGDCPPGRPCPAGGRKCEPFPESHNPVKRFVGLLYQNICCPDPCYQPRWEPIADSAFFIDPARPTNNTRFRWDYGSHLTYPDRGEYFWARADGSGKGPSPTDNRVKAVPYIDYHELSVVSEIATGKASIAISVPYRTVNTTPFGKDAAGFADMTITAKSLLVDSDLFLVALQTRTYIPTGNVGKGLGVGHVSIEPGLLFGLRLTPDTYMQGQVLEWIPIAGDADYAAAHLRWGASVNHLLWRPVKDVQLIGTAELNGISFQDGLFTDPVKGPQKLSGLNALSVGSGIRLFFCDTFDMGLAGNFGITGKYLVREQLRFEMRFRY